jgi:regulator of RNase E activity RraA
MTIKLADLDWASIAARFKRLYTPAVCDVLDGYELRHQYVHHSIKPLDRTLMIAGPAFTIVGMQNSTRDKAKRMGPRVIDSFVPHVVACYDTSGDEDGTVIVPKALIVEVLAKAEAVCEKENKIRDAIEDNASLADLYEKYERF